MVNSDFFSTVTSSGVERFLRYFNVECLIWQTVTLCTHFTARGKPPRSSTTPPKEGKSYSEHSGIIQVLWIFYNLACWLEGLVPKF